MVERTVRRFLAPNIRNECAEAFDIAWTVFHRHRLPTLSVPIPCFVGTRGSAILEPLEPPALRLCLDEDRDGYAEGWQTVPVENRPRYVESLRAFIADIRGEKSPDRSLDHEFTVQETVLRAAGMIDGNN